MALRVTFGLLARGILADAGASGWPNLLSLGVKTGQRGAG
jgi:hypothetical protein